MACLLDLGLEDESVSAEGDGPDAPANDRFGVYRIERTEEGELWELGRGAMGVTYRALDTSLQRAVALKIINPARLERGAEARARFLREARVAAGLRHPNVAVVYQFGIRQETGQCFCAMELIEGETLEARVRRTGPLDVVTTLAIARQIAAALAGAEECGLVHRDLKPANIMSAVRATDGAELPVKVIDFGIAKAIAEEPDAMALTRGGFVGTPAFASPEQFTGAPIDARSDIYSLGATLWFALTGRKPFAGRSVEEIRREQTSARPPLRQLQAARVPARLTRLLLAMLAEEPAARPSVSELGRQLAICQADATSQNRRRLVVAGGVIAVIAGALYFFGRAGSDERTPQKGIAVLPFADVSDGKTSASSLASGLHDDLLVNLSKISALKVISRNSVMQYRGMQPDVREIGRALGVDAVLEGSVRREGERVRINVQLIQSADGAQLWAENYDQALSNVVTLQRDLPLQIASALRTKLSALETARLQQAPTTNGEAYLRFIEAKTQVADYRKLQSDLDQAERLYGEAIALDPKFALAFARLSLLESTYYEMYDRTPARREKALAAAHEALRLQPDLPEGHAALGVDYWRSNAQTGEIDCANALKEFSLAEHGLPNDAEIAAYIARVERHQGQWASSTQHLKKAAALDPGNVERWHRLFFNYEVTKNFPQAARALDRTIVLAPPEDRWTYEAHRAFLQMLWKGDLGEMERLPPPRADDPKGRHTEERFTQQLRLRNYDAAEKILRDDPRDALSYGDLAGAPKAFAFGRLYFQRGQTEEAHAAYESAREMLEKNVRDNPRDPGAHATLAEAYARLDRKEEAIREARSATEIIPETKDAWFGAAALSDLARTYLMVGESEAALAMVEHLLATPGGVFRNELRFEPVWDPLRSDPRFEELLARPDVVVPVQEP